MKKLCKITSLFLAVILMFANTSVYVIADSKIQDRTAFLTALGVLKGNETEKIEAEEKLTRADAVYYALKLLGYTDIPEAVSYGYSDVTAETANADEISYALSLGILSSADEFHPDDKITIEQFMKMVLVGLGYKSVADLFGGYSEGYMSVAKNLGLLNNTGISDAAEIPYSKLNILLMNILDAGYMEFGDNNTYKSSEDKNILYDRFGIYKYSGQVTANAVTSLNDPKGIGKEQIRIADTEFDVVSDELYFDLSNKVGYKVNAFVKENNSSGTDEIIYYEVQRNIETQEIFSEDFEDFSNGKLVYKLPNGSKTKTTAIPGDCNIIYNGKTVTTPISGNLFEGKWGSIVLVKESGNITVMKITAYENYFVGAIDKDEYVIYDSTVNNRSVLFKDADGDIAEFAYFRNKTGAKMKFDQIPIGSVVSVAANDDYFDVIVTQETVSGVVESISHDDENVCVVVDSNAYLLAAEMDDSRIASIKVGSAYTFYLDACGRISAGTFKSLSNGEMDWVYLIDIKNDDTEGETDLYFKILTKSGKVTNIKCADRIKIDGDSYKSTKTTEIKERFTQNDIVLSQALKLSVDDDGYINNIDTMYMNAEKENKSKTVRLLGNADIARRWRSSLMTFDADFVLGSNAVIFVVPAGLANKANKGDNSDYGVVTTDIWRNDSEVRVAAYNSNVYSRFAEAVVTTDSRTVSADKQDYVTVVSDLIQTIDEDDNAAVLIKGIQGSTEISKFAADEKELTVNGTKIETGDIIRYGVDYEGRIRDIEIYFDASGKKYIGLQNLYNSWSDFQTGVAKAYRIEDGYLTVEADTTLSPDDPNGKKVTIKANSYKVIEVDMSCKKPTVTKSTLSAVKDWYTYGNNCSYMFMQNRYYDGKTLVIYKY
ncbi:MAG: S-layer homology domain-containing protein [Clostridia bacterium]|nr:S-layer homology domain-containing protein [Clostridia bacterium]